MKIHNIKSTSLILVLLVGAVACNRSEPDKVTEESTVQQPTPEGPATTKAESEQVGSTLAATSETEVKTPDGTEKSKVETVVGTVTSYQADKKIEVLTGANDRHSFDLDGKDNSVTIDGTIKVGSKVTVERSTDDKGKTVVNIRVEHA